MKIEAICNKPEDVELKITMTAPLSEWKILRETMDNESRPNIKWELQNQIGKLVHQFEEMKYMLETEDAAT